ncbi:Ubiquitin carboxyl-terminal hydrolase puf [Seminavis robusta]|uniref:Ubiquitin carboxyl-terminal hydrolase puf n=1 Tax=Seminavis robusta TaxID=568900 RepID=A0A9N8H414_9STRA|nr:Ubiquitin carboxyl-terminal hydrolase puf [Seminavis robusta]|eukprot:Sro102_g051930.1 Ubiquitin carboxyl-terminal hydrolase puf (3058) ;mRNA; r:14884-24699
MAAREPVPLQAVPYEWNDAEPPPTETLNQWIEVGNGIDKSQTVVWKSAVESLEASQKHLRTSEDARAFVEKYMGSIIGILVEQQPSKIGPHERTCVQDSLKLAVAIVALDLDIQLKRKGECRLLDVLSTVFNKKKAYYKGNKGNWNVNHMVGLPEVRLKMIDSFRQEHGFALLNQYLVERINTPLFPKLESLHIILQAIGDAVPGRTPGTDHGQAAMQMEDDAIAVAKAVMEFIKGASDETLKKIPTDHLSTIVHQLQKIFDRLISSRRRSTYEFYEFWRGLILKLITSQSLPLKLFGWEQMNEVIEASGDHAPPPRSFIVTNAGCTFVNGGYQFAGETTDDGYHQRGVEISYVRRVKEGDDGAGKSLTLFRCTMRSQQKWWFLSEADEEQPGTDRDIDYYQHKSKEHEEMEPPAAGWVTCRNAGIDPPPNLQSQGLMVPAGEERNTLEHQLAKWAIENGIIEMVLGDSVHREIVARSTALIKFLAQMCTKYSGNDGGKGNPEEFCLRTTHLLLAWKTCTRKTDAAVSAQVYQLLVSILPSCPSSLAIPLLNAVQNSLTESDEKQDHLNEVADFCSALAQANPADVKPGQGLMLTVEVRAEVLKLLWNVLTHPDANTLKTYDNLKRYVTNELRVEPKGTEHRETFLKSCHHALSESANKREGFVLDEVQALRMVKLTRFVLEACPREQAHRLVTDSTASLPDLLFNELTAFLERTKNDTTGNAFRKAPVHGDASVALPERLRILRYVYGLSDLIVMSSTQLHTLWNLCVRPSDREELMVFIASAAGNGGGIAQADAPMGPNNSNASRQEELLSAAFTEDVCSEVFLNLFCAPDLSYDEFGESAYKSFQFLFQRVRGTPHASGAALDALWRICLTAGNSAVANHSMKDLLSVYMSVGMPDAAPNAWTQRQQKATPDDNFNFGERVFDCLSNVKKALNEGQPGAERSAERCLRILNAAIGQTTGTIGSSMTYSTLARLSSIQLDSGLESVMRFIPHGMRGQACYRRVGIMAKRQLLSNQVGPNYVNRDDNLQGPSQSKNSTTLRFSIDVHPLETSASVKFKVAAYCHCNVRSVKPVSVSGRMGSSRGPGADSQMSLNVVPDDSVIDELGIVQGSELVFQIVERPIQAHANANKNAKYNRTRDLSDVFFDDDGRFADKLFMTLLGVLEALPWREPDVSMTDAPSTFLDTHTLVWDLLLAMPTNANIAARVRSMSKAGDNASSDDDAMDVDSPREAWTNLLDLQSFQRSVYVLLALDAFLQPSVEVLSVLPNEQRMILERSMQEESTSFRRTFIESGGFDAVVRFFSESEKNTSLNQSRKRMGNAVALRVLKCCLFGNARVPRPANDGNATGSPDEVGSHLLSSLSDAEGLLKSLTSMVVGDSGISTSTISDILKFLRLLFRTHSTAQTFVALPGGTAEQFLITLLMWEGGPEPIRTSSSVSAASKIRKSTHELILQTPILADNALPWLIRAIDKIDVSSDCTSEYFDVLQRLVGNDKPNARTRSASDVELRDLGTTVCKKVASCPRPTSENSLLDNSTGVLCGCLALLRALIETGGGAVLKQGTDILVKEVGVGRWSEMIGSGSAPKGIFASLSLSFTSSSLKPEDLALIDLMGAIFDGFLSPGGSTSVVAICSDKESRQRGFDVVGAAARFCSGGEGYLALVYRINELVESAAPFVRHKWGQVGSMTEGHSRNGRNTSKYSGLRNQGCTCYMNSVLQQMFMMPELRTNMCDAQLPSSLRSTGGVISAKGQQLVGKKVSMQWESGVSYDAMVEKFDEKTGMHTIRYCAMPVATVSGTGQEQLQGQEIARLPPLLADEFFLSEGRPGKETGVFEIVNNVTSAGEQSGEVEMEAAPESGEIKESEDEMSSRHLMEEVQRTFINLDEGSRGRCFDPRALVEACACLKLEFDVWQQNDASEFTTKLLDRLEIALKKWAPDNFQYMDHTFGLKTTKQKICKECGLKTNREEKLLNIDCQIRGKTDIHEALATMTEVEIMEGNNKVFCDRCKKNTDTVLRTALSMLPNMLILSLKRFDLDYNTFETVKLNSRCAFGQTLNMKRYTLEGLEAMEQGGYENDDGGVAPMDTTAGGAASVNDPLSKLSDEDYEYKLAGVLVHAGVAQGGHYYSFIKDRNPGSQEQWYRFDDEDVTPFDPASIEVECFGGKVKKETKWPNGQVHTVESEQYANALMLFYEKVKPTDVPPPDAEKEKEKEEEKKMPVVLKDIDTSSGYDVFVGDVRRSNATHRWQTFLFDPEFQVFLKGLLGLCRMSNSEDPTKSSKGIVSSENTWKAPVIQMLLSFFFDIMLYSSSRPYLNDWIAMMEQLFALDRDSASLFVQRLAQKTLETSPNWLRTYLIECPDQPARNAAVRIYSAAVASCIKSEEEQQKMIAWAHAWKDELSSFGQGPPTALPTMLRDKRKHMEDPFGPRSKSTSIGRLISYLNVLIEVLPRYWRYSPELACFAKNLACIDGESGGRSIRKGMLQAMIPARLIALVTRERSHHAMRAAFPGSSVSVETAETQMRPESNPVAHVMPLSGNHVMTPTDMNSRGNGAPMPTEFISVFEAVGCLGNIRGMHQVPLVVETEENTRGRARVALSKPVMDALSTIFTESCAPQAPGMGQREIESYLNKCGVDSSSVPTQKIVDIMAKYPSTGGGNGSKGSYLSLEGFLAYYRDTAQTNESRVRQDLHTFGFRPDLSRRSHMARINPDKDQMRPASESVAIDVASNLSAPVNCGPLAEYAFDSFQFFQVAYSASEPMAEYLVAGLCYSREAEKIIFATLKAIYQAPTGWGGNETLSAAIMVLKILASIPDDHQQKRVMFMLQCSEKPAHGVEHGAGLLVAARAFHQARPNQPYSSEMHYAFDRYVFVTKELLRVKTILQWLHENRGSWSFMERELLESQQHGGGRHGGQMRGMHDSEDDEDDDSRFEEMDTYHDVPSEIGVEGAGQAAVNGTYMRDGFFESAAKYSMQGKYNGEACVFQLFQCNVSNNTKHWYISIVPKHSQPGTSTDIDFYSAPVLDNCTEYPPPGTWTKSNEGLDPPPKLIFPPSPSSPLPSSEERGRGTYI